MVKKRKTSQYDEYITNKILAVFAFAFVLIVGLMVTYRGFVRAETIVVTINAVYGFSIFCAVLTAAGLIWHFVSARKGVDTKYKLANGRNLALVSAVTAVIAFIAARFYVDGIKMLYVLIPAMTVLALIYLIYSAEFFVIAAVTALGGFLMWYISRSYYSLFITQIDPSELLRHKALYAVIVSVVLMIAAVLLFAAAARHDGVLKLAGRSRKLFEERANYPLMYVSAAVTAVCAVVALVFGAAVAYYLMFVVFGYLFILAVYYTVKLM